MAVFERMTDAEIRAEFTHYALFCGLVPIYFNHDTGTVAVRNWWPEWTLDAVHHLFDLLATATGYDGGWPIHLRGRIQ